MRLMQQVDYPVIMLATPDRALAEVRRLLRGGERVGVIARSKSRAKRFEGVEHENLRVITRDIRRRNELIRAAAELEAHFDIVFLLRDFAHELADMADFNESERELIAYHLMNRLNERGLVVCFESYDASNVYALHPIDRQRSTPTR
jgi:NAD(P)-dependent dehydrogenase (short-subunit alcohol dehydrogenase family)